MSMNHLEAFKTVHTFIFDIDGVMTNNEILVTEQGELLRTMNVRDGLALKLAVQNGLRVAIITGGKSQGVVKRLQGLGIQDIFVGHSEKLEVFQKYVQDNELDPEGILYMGDDLPDYPVMRRVGIAACPKDAVPELLPIANYISPYEGGKGCVRDVIEKVLRLRDLWVVEG
jgi:3-deoxy-D-manno-octulosonate 8-phosphate phosphatase (KDO 8-P phosphatase)